MAKQIGNRSNRVTAGQRRKAILRGGANRSATAQGTYWNGLPTPAWRGSAVVADAPEFPNYWARGEGLVGQRIAVVRVVLDGVNYGGGTDYLDNRDGSGWRKVTEGHGSPPYGHASVAIEPGSFAAEGDGRG
jgi:hypothetical protein